MISIQSYQRENKNQPFNTDEMPIIYLRRLGKFVPHKKRAYAIHLNEVKHRKDEE